MCRRRHLVQMTGSEGQNGNSLAAYRAAPGDDSSGSIRQVDSQCIFVKTKEKASSSRCWTQWCLHSLQSWTSRTALYAWGALRSGRTSGGADLSPVSVEAGIGVRKCGGHQPTSRYRHRCGGYHIGAGRTQGRNKLCTHQQCPSFPNPTRS